MNNTPPLPYKALLRVEGVNLGNFIFDTNDLKTIRGGGLMLLNMAHDIKEKFSCLEEISLGASVGLFGVTEKACETIEKDIRTYLATHDNLQYATFVVSSLEIPKNNPDFFELENQLTALCRLEQMQLSNVSVNFGANKDLKGVCEIDGKLPARKIIRKGAKGFYKYVSHSVAKRRAYGHDNKLVKFYNNILKKDKKDYSSRFHEDNERLIIGFARDFHQIAFDTEKKQELNRKMAVLHFDGNQFNKTIQDIVKKQKGFDAQIKKLKEIDDDFRKQRQELMNDLIIFFIKNGLAPANSDNQREEKQSEQEKKEQAERKKLRENDKDLQEQDADDDVDLKNIIRLETLLWGGDEMIFVVPAWLAFDVLKIFYSIDWKIDGQKVTFACGVVFCSVKADIRRIKQLANDLVDSAKTACREENLIAYQVMESFDFPAEEFVLFRKKYIPEIMHSFDKNIQTPDPYIIKANEIDVLINSIKTLKEKFPRRQLYEIVDVLHNGKNQEEKVLEIWKRLKKLYSNECNDIEDAFKNFPLFYNDEKLYSACLNAHELWDYAMVIDESQCQNTSQTAKGAA